LNLTESAGLIESGLVYVTGSLDIDAIGLGQGTPVHEIGGPRCEAYVGAQVPGPRLLTDQGNRVSRHRLGAPRITVDTGAAGITVTQETRRRTPIGPIVIAIITLLGKLLTIQVEFDHDSITTHRVAAGRTFSLTLESVFNGALDSAARAVGKGKGVIGVTVITGFVSEDTSITADGATGRAITSPTRLDDTPLVTPITRIEVSIVTALVGPPGSISTLGLIARFAEPTGGTDIAVCPIPLGWAGGAVEPRPRICTLVTGLSRPIERTGTVPFDTLLSPSAHPPAFATIGLVVDGPYADVSTLRCRRTVTGLDVSTGIEVIAGRSGKRRIEVTKALAQRLSTARVGSVVASTTAQTPTLSVTASPIQITQIVTQNKPGRVICVLDSASVLRLGHSDCDHVIALETGRAVAQYIGRCGRQASPVSHPFERPRQTVYIARGKEIVADDGRQAGFVVHGRVEANGQDCRRGLFQGGLEFCGRDSTGCIAAIGKHDDGFAGDCPALVSCQERLCRLVHISQRVDDGPVEVRGQRGVFPVIGQCIEALEKSLCVAGRRLPERGLCRPCKGGDGDLDRESSLHLEEAYKGFARLDERAEIGCRGIGQIED